MLLKWHWVALALVCLAFLPARAQDAPDKTDFSYALGVNLGQQLKRTGVEVNPDEVAKAIRDVLDGKTTEIDSSQLRATLGQAQTAGRHRIASNNIAAGEAFLARNAGSNGVISLPDGLEYRVIKNGAGDLPQTNQILTLRFQGRWIDGMEFQRQNHLEIPFQVCTKGLQEALQRMKVGSEWEIFVPSKLAYGMRGEFTPRYGTVLIYDVELLAARPATNPGEAARGTGRMGHTPDEDLLPGNAP